MADSLSCSVSIWAVRLEQPVRLLESQCASVCRHLSVCRRLSGSVADYRRVPRPAVPYAASPGINPSPAATCIMGCIFQAKTSSTSQPPCPVSLNTNRCSTGVHRCRPEP